MPLPETVDLRLPVEGTCLTDFAGAEALDAAGVVGTAEPEGPAAGCLRADFNAGFANVPEGGFIWRGGAASFFSLEGGFCGTGTGIFRFVVSSSEFCCEEMNVR